MVAATHSMFIMYQVINVHVIHASVNSTALNSRICDVHYKEFIELRLLIQDHTARMHQNQALPPTTKSV